jgi:TonB family protein
MIGDMLTRCLRAVLMTGWIGLLVSPVFGVSTSPVTEAVIAARAVDDRRLAELEKETGDRPVDSILELALAYDERGQAPRAIELYRQAAARGVGVAELRLGWFNESGVGGEQSYPLARSHYERAAALGVPEANMRLGLFYLEGWGVTRDMGAAVATIRLAASSGYVPAQQILSEMYFAGTGVTADLKEALQWAEKAAGQRGAEAQALVGSIRQKAAKLPQDVQAAREWYQLSAEQEYASGMLRMATTFLKPGADPASVQMGVRWLELAAESGSTAAAFHLGGMYLVLPPLRATPDHEDRARKFLNQSAQGGEIAAAEVLELAKGSKSLTEAFMYVVTVSVEDRYMQRLAATPPTADEIAKHLLRPRPIKMVTPIYPAAMLLTKTEAEVLVEFVIDTTGRVRDARAIKSPHPAFAGPAVTAITAWRFIPGSKDGHTVNTRVQIPVRFNVGDLGIGYRNTSSGSPPQPANQPGS